MDAHAIMHVCLTDLTFPQKLAQILSWDLGGKPTEHLHRSPGDTGVHQVPQDAAAEVGGDSSDEVSAKPWIREMCLLVLDPSI